MFNLASFIYWNIEEGFTNKIFVFLPQKEEFQMYSIYCQNKHKSEALRVHVGDTNPFFKVNNSHMFINILWSFIS